MSSLSKAKSQMESSLATSQEPIERHELLVTYEGPRHPRHSSSLKTFCLSLPSSQDDADLIDKHSCYISEQDVLSSLSIKTGWPSSILCLCHNISKFIPCHSTQVGFHVIHQHAPITATIHPRHTALVGGKGGFGTLLKGQSKQAGARQTLDFGACRDLSGRRLRHVNDEIKLRKFRALQEARERGETVDELAALKTESGIRNWHLMVPNWSDGASMSNKGRRKHERQLQREVRGWQTKEERSQMQREQKKMEEEWAINEYIKRGEAEAERISSGDAVKEGMLAQLRKKKHERESVHNQLEVEGTASAVPTADRKSNKTYSSMPHLMTLSGEVSVFDLPENKQRSARLQSESDFATVVVLIDSNKLESYRKDGKTGIYMEYSMKSGGLAQVGWICSPDPESDDSPRFLPNSDTGDGVGDDDASFGYDGSRGLIFHNGEEIVYGQYQKWKAGDTLGCWCRFEKSNETIEIGYVLNGNDLGVAFNLSSKSDDLSRYFPAISLNLGEVVDMNFESSHVKEECVSVSLLIAAKNDSSSGKNSSSIKKEDEGVDLQHSSPLKKKPREEHNQNQIIRHVATRQTDHQISFDLNSCQSVEELFAMDPTVLKNILLSKGVKCG